MPTPRQTAPNLTLPTLGGGTFDLSQDAPADLNSDEVFDLTDLALFVNAFQAGCP